MNSELPKPSPRRNTYLVFTLFGALVFAAGLILEEQDIGGEVLRAGLTHLGVALGAVALIEWTWAKIGGAPLEQAVQQAYEASKSLKEEVNDLRTASQALRDLQITGIRRIHQSRETVVPSLLENWRRRAIEASEIDLIGLTLHSDWLQHEVLQDALRSVAQNKGGKIRVVILARPPEGGSGETPAANHNLKTLPASETVSYNARRMQLGERENPDVLWGLNGGARVILGKLRRELGEAVEARQATTSTLYALAIRIDQYMFIAPYLSSKVGDGTFAFEVEGPQSHIYSLYKGEFDDIFTESPSLFNDGNDQQ